MFLEGPGQDLKKAALKFEGRAMKLIEPLCDIGDKRIAAMDAAGIDFQMLSLTSPGTEQLELDDAVALTRETNDAVAETVKKHPKRFRGFAALPTMAPDKAAAELEQRVRSGGFKGAVINGHVRGRYLDDKFFWPILECAETLNAPIHIHPTKPPQSVFDAYYAGFSPVVSDMFGSPGWGWHIETAVHVIRLILGGAFDRFPKLQLVIGHLGEGLMSLFPRLDNMAPGMTKLQRPITSYLRENVYYTVSGFNYPATFLNLLLEVGVPRIMFSADHPYQSMPLARAFLDQLPVSAADRERIAHGTAEKLFGI
jgi:predicted TIM-barrel fold metal-dependent hydrolase